MGRRKKSSQKAPKELPPLINTCNSPFSESNSTKEHPTENNPLTLTPVPISSRIIYPLVQRYSKKSSTPDSDDEDTIEVNFRPRRVFINNVCLICTELCKPGFPCDQCKLVSYCTEKHKRQDFNRHKDLCMTFKEVCRKDKGFQMIKDSNPDDYRIFRVELMNLVEGSIGRRLDLWEREIILYPRVCLKCYNFDGDLECCPNCKVAFYCPGHEKDHSLWCLQYQIFHKIIFMQFKHGNVEPDIPDFIFKSPFLLPNNFDSLMAEIFQGSLYLQKMDVHSYATLSHMATIPLTALLAFQKSCKNWESVQSCVIHIVGAEFQFEGSNLHVWEKLFLHFLPNLESLKIVITGPELFLPNVPLDLLAKTKMCKVCRSLNRRANFSFVPGKLYHEFSKDFIFSRPDLICLFNPGLYRFTGFNGQDTWPQTISELCATKAPVVVTAYTEHEIPRDLERITSICSVDVILGPRRNPYASLKPDRNFVSDDTVPLIYKNYFVSIVKQTG